MGCGSKAGRTSPTACRTAGNHSRSAWKLTPSPTRRPAGVARRCFETRGAKRAAFRPIGLRLKPMNYTIVIGLEVHVQLTTESKMFSACGTEFGLPPNTQTDPVSLGLPGTLPVMNRRAFELALKTAVALHAEIAPFTKWDRKNYYYPDLPKNYQISQYDLPFSRGGWVPIPPRKDGGGGGRCGLTRVHLEEDTGKLTHAAGGLSEVDLNRAGIPLLE